jgi:hypothetical protein
MSTDQQQVQEADIPRASRPPSLDEMDQSQLLETCSQLLRCAEFGQNSRDEMAFAFDQQNQENKSLKLKLQFLEGLNELKTAQIKQLQRQIEELHEKRQNFQYAVNDMKTQHAEKIADLRAANAAAQQEIAALRAANAAEPVGDVGP